MAAAGYYPTSQIWTPGAYGCGSFLLALLLCVILVGILIFIYMLIVKPDGTLTVTYELRGFAFSPQNIAPIQELVPSTQTAVVAPPARQRTGEQRLQLAKFLVGASCITASALSFTILESGAAFIAMVALLIFAFGWSIRTIQYRYKIVFTIFVIILVVAVNGVEKSDVRHAKVANPSQNNDAVGRTLPASVTNDSELLVDRCGNPDTVLDTSDDDPRPPIPTRILTYRKAHLKIAFTSNAPIGDPPPYQWKLFGLIDTRNNKAVTTNDLQSMLRQRLPCMLGNQN